MSDTQFMLLINILCGGFATVILTVVVSALLIQQRIDEFLASSHSGAEKDKK